MEQLEQRIEINENRVLIFNMADKNSFIITEGFLENDDLLKTYTLSKRYDYNFNGWSNNNDVNKISFEFDTNHPLYIPLTHLLNNDVSLLIDDDDDIEDNAKYMLIHKEEDIIYIDFINNEKEKNRYSEKFNIFIKNIGYDGRSKINEQQKDTKERLIMFFNEAYKSLINYSSKKDKTHKKI